MADPDGPVRRRVHYVLGTHWDREWWASFQELRFDLVALLDRVLDGLDSGRLLTPFVADGQSSLIVDYLEVRPERRPVVDRLVRDGKLVLGPWHTMPDEFLVSGESLNSANLLGEPESGLEVAANGVAVALAPKKIATLVFATKEE